MKKKLLLAGAMLLLAVAAVTGFAAYEKSNVSDLHDANVEALARQETSKNGRLMYRDISDTETEYCCDRDYPDKACGAADC